MEAAWLELHHARNRIRELESQLEESRTVNAMPNTHHDKRNKAVPEEVNPVLMMIQIKRELEARIFALEQQVKTLTSRDRQRGLSGIVIR